MSGTRIGAGGLRLGCAGTVAPRPFLPLQSPRLFKRNFSTALGPEFLKMLVNTVLGIVDFRLSDRFIPSSAILRAECT